MRIAKGSGTSTTEINNLLKQFKQVQTMMKGMGGMSRKIAKSKGKKNKGKQKGPKMPAGLPAGFGGLGKGFPGLPGADDQNAGGGPGGGLPGFPPR